MFERALRYMPDDAAATAGLARSLMEAGKGPRAFALLARAVALSERHGRADADALIDMARLLATDLSDLPQAIARVRQVPAGSARAIEAAFLEAQWRASLGDVSGATLAYARLRDRIELAAEAPEGAVEWLLAAARFEREVERDVLAAERHLSVALRIAPRDRAVSDAYREVAAIVAARSQRERGAADAAPSRRPLDTLPPPAASAPPPSDPEPALETLPPGSASAAPLASLEDLAAAERLSSAVRADPGNTALVLELADVLERLGRDQELYSLLSARHEDAVLEDKRELGARLVRVLRRLAEAAEAEGHVDEAILYRAALAGLES